MLHFRLESAMSSASVLNVNLYDEPIGTLTHVSGDRTLFAFTDAYIENDDRPTLGLSFKDEFGALRTEFRPYQKRVMPFFSNLLPEGSSRPIAEIQPIILGWLEYVAKRPDTDVTHTLH